MDAEVAVSSPSEAKGKEASTLRAHKLLISTDPAQVAATAGTLNIITDTYAVDHPLQGYPLSATLAPLPSPLAWGNKVLAGSLISCVKETQAQEMLDFCGKHNIEATAEKDSYKDINHVWERLRNSGGKTRFVFDPATF